MGTSTEKIAISEVILLVQIWVWTKTMKENELKTHKVMIQRPRDNTIDFGVPQKSYLISPIIFTGS